MAAILKVLFIAVTVILVIAVVLVTVIPLSESKVWWIRVMGMPRIQILVLAVVVAVLCLFLPSPLRVPSLIAVVAAGLCQAWFVAPYSPLVGKEVELAPPADGQVQMMTANVLMENEDRDTLAGMIRDEAPDIVFLMETDQSWIDDLQPVLDGFSTVKAHPQDNHYGLVFATNLTVHSVRVVFIGDEDVPSLFAELEDRSGRAFRLVGLHPRPPVPGQDTYDRDAKIAYAARFARKSGVPVVVTGDFNDVAWSKTAHKFKRVGGYLDPRIGRGPLPSFDATSQIMRFPIDQLYITPDVALVEFHRGPAFGSDHFPMHATVRLDPDLAADLNATPHALGDAREAEIVEMIEVHAKGLGDLDIER